MTVRRRGVAGVAGFLCLAVLPPVAMAVTGPGPFVGHDLEVFFAESRWVDGGPALYSGTPSEYPLAANLLFAAVRLLADALQPASTRLASFAIAWLTLGWWMWLAMLLAIRRWAPTRAIWLWLTPTAVYFTLLHFDVFPVACTFAALVMARDGRTRWAALWLGLAIALKGYPLFAVPAFAVWTWHNAGRRETAIGMALCLAPLAVSLGIVLGLSDPEATLYPFRFQATRGPNGESTWNVVGFLTGGWAVRFVRELPWLPFVLSALGALGAAAMRPRAFDELCRAFIVGLGAFVTFSVFFSPQFALWFVPPAALCGSTLVLVTGVAIQWATFAYAPIASHLRGAPVPIYRAAMTAATIMRALFIGVALVPTHAAGGSVGGAQDLPNGPTSGGGRLPKIRSSPA